MLLNLVLRIHLNQKKRNVKIFGWKNDYLQKKKTHSIFMIKTDYDQMKDHYTYMYYCREITVTGHLFGNH